jgi:hypothetical protein
MLETTTKTNISHYEYSVDYNKENTFGSTLASCCDDSAAPSPFNQNNVKARDAYNRIKKEISDRYKNFDQKTELGHENKDGLTGDIDYITHEDLILVLEHIKQD